MVYRFLAEVVIPKLLEGQRISFLCPQHIAGSECKRIFKDSLGYVKSAFCSEVQSTSVEHSKYVLAPYNEKYVFFHIRTLELELLTFTYFTY